MRRLAVLLLVPLAAAGCKPTSDAADWPPAPGPKVVASFAPVRCFVANVAGDRAAVRAVMSTQGPHDYQPGRSDARLLASADLFVINGLGLDNDIANKMQRLAGGDRLKLVKLAERLPESMLLEGECHHDHGDGGHTHSHGIDAHAWLGLDQAERMVETVRDELKAIDPADAAGYDRRAAEYVARLRALKADGLAMLKDKKDRQFVSFHGSLTYFADTFKLPQPEVIQDVAGHEPSPKELNAMVARCVAKKMRVIAVEPQYAASGSAQAVANELKQRGLADPKVIVIDPLETCPEAEFSADWYERKTRENLRALAAALD
jgi:ABC-type Zn uptake system ZnuABC Zn-binding protein ZnuA